MVGVLGVREDGVTEGRAMKGTEMKKPGILPLAFSGSSPKESPFRKVNLVSALRPLLSRVKCSGDGAPLASFAVSRVERAPAGIRTLDTPLAKGTLYPLSYRGTAHP